MEPNDLDVVVVGNVGIDTNIYLAGRDIDFNVEANYTENLDYIGLAGGYAARGYARLGKRTACVAHVGDDFKGAFIRQELIRDGIDISGLFVDPAGTMRSVNFMYRDGRRKNFFDGKSHMTLQPDLAHCQTILRRARLAHFNIPNWARQLLPPAREAGLTIACDIQDVVNLDDPYRHDFIHWADILFCSAANQASHESLINHFLAANPQQIVVVGLGGQGCALGTQAGIEYFAPVDMDRPVIDTNGAGDGLAVGFLSSYCLDGFSLHDSVRRGQIAARYTCSVRASTDELITFDQLERYFQYES